MALGRQVVLALGVLGPALFVATDIHGWAVTPGYSAVRDVVAVLTQRGAVEGGGLARMFGLAALLQLGFGFGVGALFAGREARMVVAGRFIQFYALTAALVACAPADPVGAATTLAGVLHVAMMAASTLCLIMALLLARALPGFWALSTLCLAVMFAGAGLTGIAGTAGWPLLGLADRMMQWTGLLWLALLAVLCISDQMRRV